jgi:hypothetical protein
MSQHVHSYRPIALLSTKTIVAKGSYRKMGILLLRYFLGTSANKTLKQANQC